MEREHIVSWCICIHSDLFKQICFLTFLLPYRLSLFIPIYPHSHFIETWWDECHAPIDHLASTVHLRTVFLRCVTVYHVFLSVMQGDVR